MPQEEWANDAKKLGDQYEMLNSLPHLTNERVGFVEGLLDELNTQTERYVDLVNQLAKLQARLEVTERNLEATRDHIYAILSDTDEDVPSDWKEALKMVRFVGVRLGDACIALLKEHRVLNADQLRKLLDNGQFRFRTGYPLREINAALLRHPHVERDEDTWVYNEKTKSRARRTGARWVRAREGADAN